MGGLWQLSRLAVVMPPLLPRCALARSCALAGHRRLLHGLLTLLLLSAASLGCRPSPAPPPKAPPDSPPAAALPQQRGAARPCAQQRQQLSADLAELRRAEAALADQRAAWPAPLPPPPLWDEAREQRYSPQDQELDRQRYEQELAAWQQRRAERSDALWQRRQRLSEAQGRLDRLTRQLHQRYPTLFTGPSSIEVKPQELERLRRCPAAVG